MPRIHPSRNWAPFPELPSGKYILSPMGAKTPVTNVGFADVIFSWAFPIPKHTRFTEMGIYLSVAGDVNSRGRVALYKSNGYAYPSQLVKQTGELTLNSTGYVGEAVELSLSEALYFLCCQQKSVAGLASWVSSDYGLILGFDSSFASHLGYQVSTAYAAFPATFPSGADVGDAIHSAYLKTA